MSCGAPHPLVKDHTGEALLCYHSEGHEGRHGNGANFWGPEAFSPKTLEARLIAAEEAIAGLQWLVASLMSVAKRRADELAARGPDLLEGAKAE